VAHLLLHCCCCDCGLTPVSHAAPAQSLVISGGRLNAFSAVQFAITGNANDIRNVADTNPVPIWAWVLIGLIAVAAFTACVSAWVFAFPWQSGQPQGKDEPLITMDQLPSRSAPTI
jgi:hypothetical protein